MDQIVSPNQSDREFADVLLILAKGQIPRVQQAMSWYYSSCLNLGLIASCGRHAL